jgi:hypothetical protein
MAAPGRPAARPAGPWTPRLWRRAGWRDGSRCCSSSRSCSCCDSPRADSVGCCSRTRREEHEQGGRPGFPPGRRLPGTGRGRGGVAHADACRRLGVPAGSNQPPPSMARRSRQVSARQAWAIQEPMRAWTSSAPRCAATPTPTRRPSIRATAFSCIRPRPTGGGDPAAGPVTRRPDWAVQLAALLSAAEARPFDAHRWNCGRFALAAMEAVTGSPPQVRVLSDLEPAADSAGFPRNPPLRARMDDIVLAPDPTASVWCATPGASPLSGRAAQAGPDALSGAGGACRWRRSAVSPTARSRRCWCSRRRPSPTARRRWPGECRAIRPGRRDSGP